MKNVLLSIGLLLINITSFAQKPPIDKSTYTNWPSIGDVIISNNGGYAVYAINNKPVGGNTLVFQTTDGKRKLEIANAENAIVTKDSKTAIFRKSHDSLGIIALSNYSITYVANIGSYSLGNDFLAYEIKNEKKQLVIIDLRTSNKISYFDVKMFTFDKSGNNLVIQIEKKKEAKNTESLIWLDLFKHKEKVFWSGDNVSDITIDEKSKQLVFIVKKSVFDTKEIEKNNKENELLDDRIKSNIKEPENLNTEKSIWYYKIGTDNPVLLVDNKSRGIDKELYIDNINSFSGDGKRVFFNLKEKTVVKPNSNEVKVTVWSPNDVKLQSQQILEVGPRHYLAFVTISNLHINRLVNENEQLSSFTMDDIINKNWGLIENNEGNLSESAWNILSQKELYLISTQNGRKINFNNKKRDLAIFTYKLSPSGKFVVYFNEQDQNYYSYEIDSGVLRNITNGINTIWTAYDSDMPSKSYYPYQISGWMDDEEAVLLNDQFDIWKVDLRGRNWENITNGYGKSNNIMFTISGESEIASITKGSSLLLAAFNRSNKDNGFYRIILGARGDPKLLTMGPFIYEINKNNYVSDGASFSPIKAKDANVYIVRRMSAEESPNYFSTMDFIHFTRLSNLAPENNYNWLRTELHTWKTPNGDSSQGVLYKPQDFDPNKKYPVIFYFYERLSDQLHSYIKPQVSEGTLNIPWYVSNGYIVFVPDIHYKIGEIGNSALTYVTSAAKHISDLPFVEANKMGIQGLSFGGYEVNYIVTHTNIFAAACSSSGIFDLVSHYSSITDGGSSIQELYEIGQGRMATTLWSNPEVYLKNSPIFSVDKLNTPFLMMHTRNDGVCQFSQAIEFITAARRLKKQVWLLEYSVGNHSLSGKSAEDFDIRMAQFFNHFLKNGPVPVWIKKGVPSKYKQFTSGLEFEN